MTIEPALGAVKKRRRLIDDTSHEAHAVAVPWFIPRRARWLRQRAEPVRCDGPVRGQPREHAMASRFGRTRRSDRSRRAVSQLAVLKVELSLGRCRIRGHAPNWRA